MGFGRKPDPEPGRCRRTDGKKWRCSREAYPDSKYCEKHMHRGRNRARKSIDQNQTTPSLTSPSLSFPNNNIPSPTLSSSSSSTTYSASSSMDAYSNSNRFGVGGSSSNTRGYFNSHSLDYPYPSTSPKQQQQQQPLHHASALPLHQNTSTSQFNVLASATDHKDFRFRVLSLISLRFHKNYFNFMENFLLTANSGTLGRGLELGRERSFQKLLEVFKILHTIITNNR